MGTSKGRKPVFTVRETETQMNRNLGFLAVENADVRPEIVNTPVKDQYRFDDPSEAAAFAAELVKQGVTFSFYLPTSTITIEQAMQDELDQLHCPK